MPQSTPVATPAPATASESTLRRNTAAAEKDDALEHSQEHKPSRVVISGSRCGVLNNNEVNLAMAVLTSAGAMIVWRAAGLAGW